MDEISQLSDISIKAGTLGQIKEKEARLRERLTTARREASEIISKAKLTGDQLKDELIKDARVRSQNFAESERSAAVAEAKVVVDQSIIDMDEIRKKGELNIPSAVSYIIEQVTLDGRDSDVAHKQDDR